MNANTVSRYIQEVWALLHYSTASSQACANSFTIFAILFVGSGCADEQDVVN